MRIISCIIHNPIKKSTPLNVKTGHRLFYKEQYHSIITISLTNIYNEKPKN